MFIRTPFTNPLVLLPVILSALMFYVTAYGQFIPILINPNFQSDSGVIGTYYSGPHTYHGGQEGYKVALFKWDIPDNLDRANKGLSGLFTFLAAVKVVEIVRDTSQWEWIEGKNSEAIREKGCLRLHGRLDGGEIHDDLTFYRQQISWLRHTLNKIHTIMARHKAVGEKESQEYAKSMVEMSEKISTVMRDFQAAQPQQGRITQRQVEEEQGGI
tara:strand:- start:15145 stop:15786 length:642 start_codon:yes stop_codon:yes gene_type:complete